MCLLTAQFSSVERAEINIVLSLDTSAPWNTLKTMLVILFIFELVIELRMLLCYHMLM